MSNIYDSVPVFENDRWLLRFVEKSDAEDLIEVYGDKNALPFFNSDNCDGDNFYYHTKEQMDKAMDFWLCSYKEKWFVRWAIIDKMNNKAMAQLNLSRGFRKMRLMKAASFVLILVAVMKGLMSWKKSCRSLSPTFLKCSNADRL